jgi:hypothetical protein
MENDKKEINTLQKVIKDTLGRNDRKKEFSSLKLYNNIGSSFKVNSLENLNHKVQTFYPKEDNIIPELNTKVKYFNSTLNKDHLFKSSSYNILKDFNKTKNSTLYSNKTSTNIFQQSTYYSNSTKNKTTFNQINFNSPITPKNSNTIQRNLGKEKTAKIQAFKKSLQLKNIVIEQNDKKRKTSIKPKHKSFEDLYENNRDNIYSICQQLLENKNLSGERQEYLNMITKYIKSKTNYTINENQKNNLKDTIIFFNKFKERLKIMDNVFNPE